MKYVVSAETTIDLTKEILDKYQIKTLPFSILLGDKNYYDGEITCDDIIQFVNKTKILPKTGAVNKAQYDEHFDNLLKDYDGIIHISLSSELSSAYSNAVLSAKERKNVFVIDSRTLSTGIALLAIYAKELIDEGNKLEDIYKKVLDRVPNTQVSFALKRVDYLYKGGRCSMLSYLGANLLKISPQLIVKDGKMIAGKKFRGNFKHVVENYCNDILENYNTPDLSKVFITYTTSDQETLTMVENILKERGFEDIYITRAGGTITSHCGENCLGILYMNDGV